METTLETRKVTRFVLRRSLIHKLEKKDKEETEDIRNSMQSGALCPQDGPFLLELNDSEQTIGWKEIFAEFLTKKLTPRYGKRIAKLKAAKKMQELYVKAEKKPVVKILCKGNPKWSEKVKEHAA